MKGVHQPPRAAQSDTHPPLGDVAARQYGIEVRYTRSLVADDDLEDRRCCVVLDSKLGSAAAGIFERVACQLGNGGGDARLILPIEAQELGDTARSFANEHDVWLSLESHEQKAGVHVVVRIATIVTSSRSRRW